MTKPQFIIGCDPDAEANGVAVFKSGQLVKLANMNNAELVESIRSSVLQNDAYLFSIEDVMANQFVYARNVKASKAAQSKIAMHIGRCQQAQVELMRWLDLIGIRYVLHRPQKGNWSDNKPLFEKVTGWKARSNADTRSAAYFGYLEARKITC